jgi:hypothetical protein
MAYSSFDAFVLNAATQHGVILYIVFVVLTQILGGIVGVRLGRRRTALADFPMLAGVLLINLFSFLAFASLTGHFPKELWLASLAISTVVWLGQCLLAWTASKSEVEFDVQKISRDARTVQAIVMASSKAWLVVMGLSLIAATIFQYGLLIYSGFLFDPGQMNSTAYQAKIATYLLILPAAVLGAVQLLTQIPLLASKYTPPAMRNLHLAGAVGLVANSLLMVLGPLYFYRAGFPDIASFVEPLGTVVTSVSGIFALVLLVPYAVGAVTNGRFATNLQASLAAFIARAEELSKQAAGNHRENEKRVLQERILEAFTPLTRNRLLLFFALKLLEKFAEHPGTDAARQQRLLTLRMLGFGNEAPFEGNPIGEIQQVRENIAHDPFYRFNMIVKEYFDNVEKNFDQVAQAHPLLLNFQRLTTVLRALVDDVSAQERSDIFADLRPREATEGGIWNWIKQTIPGWLLTFIMTYIVSPFSDAFGQKVRATFETLIKALFSAG